MSKAQRIRRTARSERPRQVNKNFRAVLDTIHAFQATDGIELGETPARAHHRCHEVSLAFAWFAKGQGEDAVMIQVIGTKFAPTNPIWGETQIRHWLVWFPIDQIAVDWTAREFWPEVGHPLIMN